MSFYISFEDPSKEHFLSDVTADFCLEEHTRDLLLPLFVNIYQKPQNSL